MHETFALRRFHVPGTHARQGFHVVVGQRTYALPQIPFEYALELIAERLRGGVLYNECSVSCEGVDPDDAARHLVQRLRRILGGSCLVTARKAYGLSPTFTDVTVASTVFEIPYLNPRILARLRKAIEHHQSVMQTSLLRAHSPK